MGRQSGDSTMVSSSIALLQERFRRLERMREKREEKMLSKMFNEPDQISPPLSFEPKRPYQPEMMTIHPPRPNLEDSLSLGLNSPQRMFDLQSKMVMPPLTNPSLNYGSGSPSTSMSLDTCDVDTSLRL